MSRRDAAQVLAMCAWVKQQVKKIEEKARAEADVTFPDEKTAGVVDGKVVSYTQRVSRKPELKFDDEFRFIEWVSKHYPTEIMWAVRPAFLTELRDRAIDKDGIILGPGGEVCEVAGLDEPVVYTTTRLEKTANDVLEPLLSRLDLSKLPGYINGLDVLRQPVTRWVEPEPTNRYDQDREAAGL